MRNKSNNKNIPSSLTQLLFQMDEKQGTDGLRDLEEAANSTTYAYDLLEAASSHVV